MAINGLQWLRNIVDGAYDAYVAVAFQLTSPVFHSIADHIHWHGSLSGDMICVPPDALDVCVESTSYEQRIRFGRHLCMKWV